MKNINIHILIVALFFLAGTPIVSFSQSSEEASGPQTLKKQFQNMLDKSESYTDYKVVKRTNLSQYSKAVQDSIGVSRIAISKLKSTVADQKSQIAQLSSRITDLENQLSKSEELRESLSFVGININKATYHWIVWLIIGALVVFGIFAFGSFMRSNGITSKVNKEYKELELEFELHKKKSQEKQLKMGRELQTERNLIEELKSKIKSRSTGKL